jgi:hypothetical protein
MNALQQYFEHLVTFGLVAEHPLEDGRTTLRMVASHYDSHWLGLGFVRGNVAFAPRGIPKPVKSRLACLGFKPTYQQGMNHAVPDPIVWALVNHRDMLGSGVRGS